MKYYVRTTGERDLSAYSSLDYTPLYDYEHKPVESFIEQMKIISKSNAVFMEDDIILCKDFEAKLEEAVKKYPGQVINFFFQPLAYLFTGEVEGKRFLYNQCVYYPRYVAGKIAKEMERLVEEGIKWKQYDEIQAVAMQNLGINFINYRPCLVQHVGKQSLLGNKWLADAKTIYFIDDIEGMNYDDAKAMLDYGYAQYDKLGIPYTRPRIIVDRHRLVRRNMLETRAHRQIRRIVPVQGVHVKHAVAADREICFVLYQRYADVLPVSRTHECAVVHFDFRIAAQRDGPVLVVVHIPVQRRLGVASGRQNETKRQRIVERLRPESWSFRRISDSERTQHHRNIHATSCI